MGGARDSENRSGRRPAEKSGFGAFLGIVATHRPAAGMGYPPRSTLQDVALRKGRNGEAPPLIALHPFSGR